MVVGDLLNITWCNARVLIVSEKHGCKEYTVSDLRETRQDIMREMIKEVDVITDNIGNPRLHLNLHR